MFTRFFYPRTLCVAGASSKEKSIGYELLRSIKEYNYTGTLYPVNPKADEILGYKCFPSIEAIPEAVDLAIIVVPKAFVRETIASLAAKGVKSIILITAGFKETGEAGQQAEKELVEYIRSQGMRMVGPNCMGIINTSAEIKLNATFVAEKPREARAGFLSQSGALGAAVLNGLRESGISFGHFISVGNKADVNENDLLEYWLEEKSISAVAMYLESFVDGARFLDIYRKTKSRKPVVVVKAGRTGSGMKAASSHTGALGSSERVVDALLKQFGFLRADTVQEMFNTVSIYERFPLPEGNRVAVLTNAGGPAILCVDELEKQGLTLARLTEPTKEKLREFVHPEGSVNNPVDLLPGGTAEQYTRAADLLAQDDEVDAVVSIFVEPVMVPALPVVSSVYTVNSPKPVVQVVMPLPEFHQNYKNAYPEGKPYFRTAEEPARVLANLLRYNTFIAAERLEGKVKKIAEPEGWLSPEKTASLAKEYGLPVISSAWIAPGASIPEYISYPLVIKGIAPGETHKSEKNLVRLNIRTEEEAVSVMKEMKVTAPGIVSFEIQPYLQTRFELLIGGFRDPSFGPVIMFGSGGKYVEVYNDTALRHACLSGEDITAMMEETKMCRLLKGVRGEKPADLQAVAAVIKNAAQMLLDYPQIQEFDLNPLIVTPEGKNVVVDMRIRIAGE
ncbi:MAG: Protein lysine acetyltransferase Pat [Ignavibacteriaceae bacterium]|nr:Protein lysine acetyltransferase Pat [Ignavibacteriaceae bacterium]